MSVILKTKLEHLTEHPSNVLSRMRNYFRLHDSNREVSSSNADESRRIVFSEEVSQHLQHATGSSLVNFMEVFHQRYPDEEVWPPGTELPLKGAILYLDGMTLPSGTVLPEGLRHMFLEGGTLPNGTILPKGLKEIYLNKGSIASGVEIPKRTKIFRHWPLGIRDV